MVLAPQVFNAGAGGSLCKTVHERRGGKKQSAGAERQWHSGEVAAAARRSALLVHGEAQSTAADLGLVTVALFVASEAISYHCTCALSLEKDSGREIGGGKSHRRIALLIRHLRRQPRQPMATPALTAVLDARERKVSVLTAVFDAHLDRHDAIKRLSAARQGARPGRVWETGRLVVASHVSIPVTAAVRDDGGHAGEGGGGGGGGRGRRLSDCGAEEEKGDEEGENRC